MSNNVDTSIYSYLPKGYKKPTDINGELLWSNDHNDLSIKRHTSLDSAFVLVTLIRECHFGKTEAKVIKLDTLSNFILKNKEYTDIMMK